jgi:K+-transporting ATPase c subunit
MVRAQVDKATDRPFLGIGGDPGVNVLKLNIALDGIVQTNSLAEKKQ